MTILVLTLKCFCISSDKGYNCHSNLQLLAITCNCYICKIKVPVEWDFVPIFIYVHGIWPSWDLSEWVFVQWDFVLESFPNTVNSV